MKEYHDKSVSTRASIDGGCFKKTMERALPLELSEESKRAWQTTRRAFECFPVASCDSFSTLTPPPPILKAHLPRHPPYFENALICPHPLHHERPSTRRLPHPHRPGCRWCSVSSTSSWIIIFLFSTRYSFWTFKSFNYWRGH